MAGAILAPQSSRRHECRRRRFSSTAARIEASLRVRWSRVAPEDEGASPVAFLRHPLLVGAAVTVIGAVFASLLIPSITQVAQDRPKELELKRTIVEGIAAATATALNRGVALGRGDLQAAGGHAHEAPLTVYRRVYGDWLVAESTLDAEVTTYFSEGGARSHAAWTSWRALKTGITDFLRLSTLTDSNIRRSSREYLEGLLRSLHDDAERSREVSRDLPRPGHASEAGELPIRDPSSRGIARARS